MSSTPSKPVDFEALHDQITDLYATLSRLADDLAIRTTSQADEPTREFLANLEWRLPLDEVRDSILAARHELHGGLTALAKVHGRTFVRRPTHDDPSNHAPGADVPPA